MEVIDRDGTVIRHLEGDSSVQTSAHMGLVVVPHPLTQDGRRIGSAGLLYNETLAAFLARVAPEVTAAAWVVAIDGAEVPAVMWGRTRPKPGVLVECRRVVREDVVKIAALIAISYFTFGVGGLGAGGLFTSGGLIGGGFLAAAGAFIAGTMLVNQLLGPKQPGPGTVASVSSGTTYNISGGNNQARAYEPLTLLFGEVRFSPDFSSVPYTWFEGDDQVLYEVLHGGINCGSVFDIRIGKTPLDGYQDWASQTEGFAQMGHDQLLYGYTNVDTVAGAKLEGGPFLNNWGDYTPGPWVMRTTPENTVLVQIDLEGSTYFMGDDGKVEGRGAFIEGQVRKLPDGAWESRVAETYGSNKTDPIRITVSLELEKGQYEIRFRKSTADRNMSRENNNFAWSRMKSIQPDAGYYRGIGRFGLKIKATGQLNGSLDTINWLGRAKPITIWNGLMWTTATTPDNGLSNPGANILAYARGYYDDDGRLQAGMGLPDESIDIESLQGFMVRCTEKGFRFDWLLDKQMSHQEVLDSLAAAGMGAIAWPSGKLGVIWFAEDEPISGVVNMATMTAGSFSVDYVTLDTADGLEYQYYDREQDYTWQPIRVIDPEVETALNPSRIMSVGITDADHAAMLARFHLAQSLYQRKTISFDTDLEHLTYRRGSLLALTHDVTQWGYGGRLVGASSVSGIVTLVLDEDVPAGASAYIGLRLLGEQKFRIFSAQARTEPGRTVVLTSPWPVDAMLPGLDGEAIHDALWIYDFKATPGNKVRVTQIQPKAGMEGATITCVPEGPEFWNYILNGTYEPAPNNSRLGAAASVDALVVTETLTRQGNTFGVTLMLTMDYSGMFDHAEIWGAANGAALALLDSTRTMRYVVDAALDDVWSFEVRPFDTLARLGKVRAVTHTVEGLRSPPADIPWITMEGDKISFGTVGDVDLAGYVFRFHYGYNLSWGDANPLHDGLVTSSPFAPEVTPQGPITLMGRAIDTTGNLSTGIASIQTGFGDVLVANIVERMDYRAAGYPGTLTGGVRSGGKIQASGTGLFYGNDAANFWPPTSDGEFYADQYQQLVYETDPFTPSAGEVGAQMTLDADLAGGARSIEYRAYGGEAFYAADPAALFYVGADDDPFYPVAPSYQGWPGAVTVQAMSYQFRISIAQGPTQGIVDACAAVVDVRDIDETFSMIAIPAAGLRLPIGKKYFAVKNVQLTLHSDGGSAAQARWVDKDAVLGPLVQCFTSAGAATAGTVDARIQGY